MKFKDLPIMSDKEGVVLFKPHIPKNAKKAINKTLNTRWIGQGPQVDKFEKIFSSSSSANTTTLTIEAYKIHAPSYYIRKYYS